MHEIAIGTWHIPKINVQSITPLSHTVNSVIKPNFGGSVMEKIPGLYAQVQHDVLKAGKTHAQIAEELQARYPGEQGFSTRSVRRFCSNQGIRSSSGLSDSHLDKVVASGVSKVCH